MILCHLYRRLFEKNSCLPFESERRSVRQIQGIQGLDGESNRHEDQNLVIRQRRRICVQKV
jgi:hypothetical protein